jgi:Protein of unknown function (DUF2971)
MKKTSSDIQQIYKYCSADTARLILSNNEILLNSADNFNDPYDSKIHFDERDLNIASNSILNYFLDQSMEKIINEHYHNFKPIQKMLVFIAKLTFKLKNSTNFKNKEYRPAINYSRLLSTFNTLGFKNGPKDSDSQKALDEIVSLKKSSVIKNKLYEIMNTISNNLLISCFSKIDDSTLMWAHYGDYNKGVCLEFENEEFLEVFYSKKRSPIVFQKLIYKILWNYHVGKTSTIEKEQEHKYLLALAPLLTKSKDWEYEAEVRCIFTQKNEKVIEKSGKYFYRMKKINSIILGCRVNSEDEKYFRQIALDNNISIYKMRLDDSSYKLIKEKQ